MKSLIHAAGQVISSVVKASEREAEITRQMALLRMEQASIKEAKIAEEEDNKRKAILLDDLSAVQGEIRDLQMTRKTLQSDEDEALFKIRNQYKLQYQQMDCLLVELQAKEDKLNGLLGANIHVSNVMPSSRAKDQFLVASPISREVIVPLCESKEGANDLMGFLGQTGGRLEFKVLDKSGPDHSPIFTAQLLISWPSRRPPLKVSYVATFQTSKQNLKTYMSISILHDAKSWYHDLTVCGDVHANPGPEHSRFLRQYTRTQRRVRQERLEGFYEEKTASTNRLTHNTFYRDLSQPYILPKTCPEHDNFTIDKYARRNLKKACHNFKNWYDISNDNYNFFNPILEEMPSGEPEYIEKLRNNKYFRTEQDEKNKRMERDYRSKHKKLKSSPYTGEMKDDVLQFRDYLNTHGYASNQVHKITPYFIQQIFESWARNGKLINTKTAYAIWQKFGKFEIRIKHGPQYRARKLLLKAFVCSDITPELEYLRIILNVNHKMPADVGVTLKDAMRTHDRLKRKYKHIDMTGAQSQMKTSDIFESTFSEEKDSWVGGTLRYAGRKIAEGMSTVVMPVVNNLGSTIRSVMDSMPSVKNILVVVKILAIVTLVAILGWALVTLTRTITMGVDSFIPTELGPCYNMEGAQPQHFSFAAMKSVGTSWWESVGNSLATFNRAFSDSEIVKGVKKIGDFSSALKNCGLLCEKMRDMIVWIMNKTCLFMFERPFFQNACNVHMMQQRIDELMVLASTETISSLDDVSKRQCVIAYMDLMEMYPYISKVDKVLGAQMNLVITKANGIYRECEQYLKTNVTRMEPWHIMLKGETGQRKSYLMDHLIKMIYDCMRTMSPKTWKALWYKGICDPKVTYEFIKTLIYNRKVEQEFWDNYCSQPVTKMDDIGQLIDALSRAAEFISVIRMVNNEAYPLHMAELSQKANTNFTSFLLLSSTNLEREEFKKHELGILKPEAFLRRIDAYVEVDWEGEHVDAGINSVAFLNNYTLDVHKPNKKNGELGKPVKLKGYKEITEWVEEMTRRIIRRYDDFAEAQFMDHTSQFIKQQVNPDGIEDLQDEIYVDLNTGRFVTSTGPGIIPLTTAEEVKITTTSNSISGGESDSDSGDINMTGATSQMLMVGSVVSTAKNIVYPVHPSIKLFIQHYTGAIVETYEDACVHINSLRKEHSFLNTSGWDHDYIISGVKLTSSMSIDGPRKQDRLSSFLDYCCFAPRQRAYNYPELAAALGAHFPTKGKWAAPYIGLSNPLYWSDHDVIQKLVYKHTGSQIFFFDDLFNHEGAVMDFDYGQWEPLILYEVQNQKFFLARRGKSLLEVIWEKHVMILGALVGIAILVGAVIRLYQYLNPAATVDMKFVEAQSSDPRLTATQRAHIATKTYPVVKHVAMKGSQPQMMDTNATSLLPIVRRNKYHFRTVFRDGKDAMCTVVGLKKNYWVIPAHITVQDIETIYLTGYEDTRQFEFAWDKCKVRHVRPDDFGFSTADLAIMYVPTSHFVADITNLLCLRSDVLHDAMGICREELVDKKLVNGLIEKTYELVQSPSPVRFVNGAGYEHTSGFRKVNTLGMALIETTKVTRPGDCVEPYIFFNPKVQRKLGLFHFALMPSKTHCAAGRLNKEDVDDFDAWLNTASMTRAEAQIRRFALMDRPIILPQHSRITYTPVTEGALYGIPVIGELNTHFGSPTETQIIKTPMCVPTEVVIDGEVKIKEPPFQIKKRPAILRWTKQLDPMMIGINTLKDKKMIYRGYIEREDYDGIFTRALRHCNGRILEIWEVLKGTRNHPKSHSLKRNSSWGFYHKIFNKKKREYCDLTDMEFQERKDKIHFISCGQGTYLHKDVLDIVVAWFRSVNDKSEIPLNWVIAMLKDELRFHDRVDAGKTRVFYAGMFAFLIISRMIFGEFTTFLEAEWWETDMALGCNPYSNDWAVILKKLLRFGTKVKDDDVSKWDQHFQVTEFVTSFCPAYVDQFALKDKLVVVDLLIEKLQINHEHFVYAVTICCFHNGVVIGKKVIFSAHMPSGIDLTALFNSIMNSAKCRCIIRIHVLSDGQKFDDVAVMWVYGDDLILNCPLISRTLFWAAAKQMFDHEHTRPDKGLATEDTPIDQAFFLQRQFRYKGRVLCPLNIDSIDAMLQYIEQPTDRTEKEQFVTNCKTALMELSRHPKEVYEYYRKEINIYLMQYGTSWIINTTYEEAFQAVLNCHIFGF